MSLRLSNKMSPAAGVRRLARRELGKAADALTRPRRPAESVHVARKHVKKVRALLRLVRKRVGSKVYRAENTDLRELGRQLSAVRDAQVVLKILSGLREVAACQPEASALKTLHEQLTDSSAGAASPNLSAKAARDRASEFERCRRRVNRWSLKKLVWPDLTKALVRSYRRNQTALARYDSRRTPLNLHEWRKRTKDFWHQLLMLEARLCRSLRRLAPVVESLTEAQGEAHDLDLLLAALNAQRGHLPAGGRTLILQLIQKRLRQLEQKILKTGRKVFCKPPERFARQLDS